MEQDKTKSASRADAEDRLANPKLSDVLLASGLSKNVMVEHIGFEPMTSSMPWKRASQLRQCPVPTDCSKKIPLFPEIFLVVSCCAPTRGLFVSFQCLFLLPDTPRAPLKAHQLTVTYTTNTLMILQAACARRAAERQSR